MQKSREPIQARVMVDKLTAILQECFMGAQESGAFLIPGPNGLFDLLQGLTAREASTPVAGASMAAHALHVAFSLDAFLDWIHGKRGITYDWAKSWAKSEVTDKEWEELRQRLHRQYTALCQAVHDTAPYDADSAWGAIGVLAHTAYHLGALQVKADELRSGQ